MTALSADLAQARRGEGICFEHPVAASTTIYKGSLVSLNSSGYAIPAADTASTTCVGVAEEKVDNSAGSAGDKNVVVRRMAEFEFATASLVLADVGKNCFVADDQTVGDAAAQTNDIKVGVVTQYVSATKVRVLVGVLAATDS